MAELNFNVVGNNADLIGKVEQIRIAVQGTFAEYQKEGKEAVTVNDKLSLSFKKVWNDIDKTKLFKDFFGDIAKVRSEFQQLETAYSGDTPSP